MQPHTQAQPLTLTDLFMSRPCEKIAREQGVFWEDDAAEFVLQIVGGVGRSVRVFPEGDREVLAFVFPGDVVSLSFSDSYPFTFEAVTAIRFRRIRRSVLLWWAEQEPAIASTLIDLLRAEVRQVRSHAHLLSKASADFRIANFLLSVADRTPGALLGLAEFSVVMSRIDIADHLGLTMETVCRTVTKFRREGLIVTRGPHQVRLRDPNAVRRLARQETKDWIQVAPQLFPGLPSTSEAQVRQIGRR
jgi:CRP/FNR family transcriptional regulator, anaerobic regulatory protein